MGPVDVKGPLPYVPSKIVDFSRREHPSPPRMRLDCRRSPAMASPVAPRRPLGSPLWCIVHEFTRGSVVAPGKHATVAPRRRPLPLSLRRKRLPLLLAVVLRLFPGHQVQWIVWMHLVCPPLVPNARHCAIACVHTLLISPRRHLGVIHAKRMGQHHRVRMILAIAHPVSSHREPLRPGGSNVHLARWTARHTHTVVAAF
jgi:hypothetical protein